MKKRLSLVAPLFLLATVACKPSEQPVAQDTVAPSATTSAAQAAPASVPYDLQFLDSMSAHHASAIQMATLAQGTIRQPELKKLAARIPGDQQKEVDHMKAWRDQWYPGASKSEPMAMPGMNMDMSKMQAMKPGKDYDAMFVDMMIPHHQSAVTMAQEALTRAEHPEIKSLAQEIIDAQTKEITQMQKIKAALKK